MSDKKVTKEHLLDAIFHMNLAQSAAIMTLVKTLEQSDLMSASEYARNLRLASTAMANRAQVGAAGILDDLADLISHDETTPQ